MLHLQNLKYGILLSTTAVATNADSGTYVDTDGFDEAVAVIQLGVCTATNAPTTIQLEQGDTTSSFTAITGYTGGTASTNGFTIAAQSTAAATTATYVLPLVKGIGWNKRYINLKVRLAGGTANVTGVLILGRAKSAPVTAAEVNATVLANPA